MNRLGTRWTAEEIDKLVEFMKLEKPVAEIAEELALPPVKIHCSVLAEDAIKAAVKDYRDKHQLECGE